MTTATAPQTAYNPAIFRIHRQRRRWTQAEAGRRVGRNQDYWSRLELGKKPPTLPEIERIASAFGISPKTLARQAFETAAAVGE